MLFLQGKAAFSDAFCPRVLFQALGDFLPAAEMVSLPSAIDCKHQRGEDVWGKKKKSKQQAAFGKLSLWRNVDCRGREQINKKKWLKKPTCQGLLSDFSKLKAIMQV